MAKELKSARLSREKMESCMTFSNATFFKSHIAFLSEHKGYRPKCIHLVLGMPSGGKSTLLRTMLFDLSRCGLTMDETCLVWLSEESKEQFDTELNQAITCGSKDWTVLERIMVLSEMDGHIDFDSSDEFSDWQFQLLDYIAKHKASVLFLDNITTSRLYSGKTPSEQTAVSLALKDIAKASGVAIVIFAHTKSSVKSGSGLIDINDIRGSATIVNISEFQYICQKFDINKDVYNTLRIVKHRGQNIKNPFFYLPFHQLSRAYQGICPIDFEVFKDKFNQRNRL